MGADQRAQWEGAVSCEETGQGWRMLGGDGEPAGWGRLVRGGALAVDDELAGWEGAVSAASGGDWRELDVVCPNEHGVD